MSYKNYIIESLQQKIDILENNQKPKVNTKKGVIYFIRSQLESDDIFKLGKSKKFKKRLLSHNSSHSDDVEIAIIFETEYIDQVEGCLKSILKKHQYRKRKEIYQINIDILKEIMEGCNELVNRIDVKKNKKIARQKNNNEYNYFLYIDKNL